MGAPFWLGRRGIGIEIDPGYFEIAKRRIKAELSQGKLADEAGRKDTGGTPMLLNTGGTPMLPRGR